MGIEPIQEYLAMVASIVTSVGVLWVPFKLAYLDPREKLKKAEKKIEQQQANKLIDDNDRRHTEMLSKLEEATSQQTQLFEQHDARIHDLEKQNEEHDGRILVLEKHNGVKSFGFVEKEGE